MCSDIRSDVHVVVMTKEAWIQIRVTTDEKARLVRAAATCGESLTAYMLRMCLRSESQRVMPVPSRDYSRVVADSQPRDVPARQVTTDPKPLVPSLPQQLSGKRSFSPDPKIK